MVSGRLLPRPPGITGLPHWFEMACLLTLLSVFILLLGDGEIFIYRDISLEDDDAAEVIYRR